MDEKKWKDLSDKAKEKAKELSEKAAEKAKDLSEKAKNIDKETLKEEIENVKEDIKKGKINKKAIILGVIAIVAILFILYILFGRANYISEVKKSTLYINNGTTIGDAFDNWQSCSDTDWIQTKTKNGRIYVIYTCRLKGVESYTKNILKHLGEENKKALIIKDQNIKVKFLISHDGKSFTLDEVDYICTWGDGKTTIYRMTNVSDMKDTLKDIYNNNNFWPEVKSGSYSEVVVAGMIVALRNMSQPYNE